MFRKILNPTDGDRIFKDFHTTCMWTVSWRKQFIVYLERGNELCEICSLLLLSGSTDVSHSATCCFGEVQQQTNSTNILSLTKYVKQKCSVNACCIEEINYILIELLVQWWITQLCLQTCPYINTKSFCTLSGKKWIRRLLSKPLLMVRFHITSIQPALRYQLNSNYIWDC